MAMAMIMTTILTTIPETRIFIFRTGGGKGESADKEDGQGRKTRQMIMTTVVMMMMMILITCLLRSESRLQCGCPGDCCSRLEAASPRTFYQTGCSLMPDVIHVI